MEASEPTGTGREMDFSLFAGIPSLPQRANLLLLDPYQKEEKKKVPDLYRTLGHLGPSLLTLHRAQASKQASMPCKSLPWSTICV